MASDYVPVLIFMVVGIGFAIVAFLLVILLHAWVKQKLREEGLFTISELARPKALRPAPIDRGEAFSRPGHCTAITP